MHIALRRDLGYLCVVLPVVSGPLRFVGEYLCEERQVFELKLLIVCVCGNGEQPIREGDLRVGGVDLLPSNKDLVVSLRPKQGGCRGGHFRLFQERT